MSRIEMDNFTILLEVSWGVHERRNLGKAISAPMRSIVAESCEDGKWVFKTWKSVSRETRENGYPSQDFEM